MALLGFCSGSKAQDCSAITKYGIFDVRHTSQQVDLVDDLVKWLSVNEYKTENDAKNAAARAGITIPVLDISLNADGTYGESHASTWSKAVLDFLHSHKELHTKFAQDFSTANPQIVSAWQACVTQVTGLVCWVNQTDNPNEVMLNIEVRPISLPLSSLTIAKIVTSPNLKLLSLDWKKSLNVKVTPLLYSRSGPDAKNAANFTVDTNSDQYRCSAGVPGLPPPAPVWETQSALRSVPCVVGRNDFVGEGPKIGDKHLLGISCHAPAPVVSINYLGCFDSNGVKGGGACPWLDRHEEYDLPAGPYPKGTDVNLAELSQLSTSEPVKCF